MRDINLIVIHCSATPNGVYVSPQQIDAWHAAKGFRRQPEAVARWKPDLPHIGYHELISVVGSIWGGRTIEEVGAHALGHNANSIGICMIGTDRFYLSQWNALTTLLFRLACELTDLTFSEASVDRMLVAFKKRGIRIVGHRDLSPDTDGDGKVEPHEWLKTCPGFDVSAWLAGGMRPLQGHILDDHPAIASASATVRIAAKGRL